MGPPADKAARNAPVSTRWCLSLLLTWAPLAQAAPEWTKPAVPDADVPTQLSPATDVDDEEASAPEFTTGPVGPDGQPAHGSGQKFGRPDTLPYFATGNLAKAAEQLRRGRHKAASLLLAAEADSRPVRYLKAKLAMAEKDYAAASSLFLALSSDYPQLKDYLKVDAGRAFEQQGKWTEAAAAYADVEVGSQPYVDACFGMARAREQSDDRAGAMAALAPLVRPGSGTRSSDAAEAFLQIARLAGQQGDAAFQHRALVALWALHPTSHQARKAKASVDKNPPPLHWQVARAETLISMHLNREGMKLVLPLIAKLNLPEELACRAHFAYGTALRKERSHGRAISVLRPVVESCTDPTLRARALFVLGYSQAVVDREGAVRTYETLTREYPAHAYADDALFYAAEAKIRLGNEEGALSNLKLLSDRYPNGDFAAEALFTQAWSHREHGDYDQALGKLARIEALRGRAATHEMVSRARYWRARVLSAMGREDEALGVLERVAADSSATYYGLLARSRLTLQSPARAERVNQKLSTPVKAEEVWPLDAGSMAKDPHFLTGIELLRLQHPAGASELLSVNRKGQSEEAIRLLIHVLRSAGHLRHAQVVSRAFLREGLSGPTQAEARLIYELAYPHEFRGLVEKHSKAAQVDPDLMQALIREESAFNPRARSATGALGLAQLMPATASKVARSIRAPRVTQRSLLNPRKNIQLGSAYLGELHRQFEGNPAHAVASYNAGPNAVNRWLKVSPTAELDEWVEEIPIEETRNYVKRVLGSYGTYGLLYESGSPSVLAIRQPGAATTAQ